MLRRDESGASAVEYALIVALVVGVAVAAIFSFGHLLGAVFEGQVCNQANGYDCCPEDATPEERANDCRD